MTGRDDPREPTSGPLDPRGAFVVQFRTGSRPAGPVAGRIEHVSSGRSRRFASVADMEAFMLEMLPPSTPAKVGSDGAG